jgi:hypothetical protein
MPEKTDRRAFLNQACLGAVGVGAACGLEGSLAMAAMQRGQGQPDQATGDAGMPTGRIGNITMSRLLSGGNMIGGWMHARDLIYVTRLSKAYNTDEKVFETLELAEQHGIDTIQIDPACCEVVEKYRKQRGSKIQTMICMAPNPNEAAMRDQIKRLIDWGATLLYTHGEMADRQTMAGRLDVLAKAIELIKAEGVPAGIGSHSLQTPIACEKEGVGAEYYVKTYHLDRYWSATPKENREEWCWYKGFSQDRSGYHDNIWCLDPEETAAFFETVEKPWVAFKVLAAGAIQPQVGISSAFRNGADFVIVGMFDFQVAQDAALVREAVEKTRNRKRPWRA